MSADDESKDWAGLSFRLSSRDVNAIWTQAEAGQTSQARRVSPAGVLMQTMVRVISDCDPPV